MRDTCIRTKIEFIGDGAERLNIKQKEWIELLPEIDEKKCLICSHGNIDFCQSSITNSINMRFQCQSKDLIREDVNGDCFLFKSIEDAEEFAKMLFFLWNSDGSTLELDYADLYQYFSSSSSVLRPITLLAKNELVNINDGIVACFSLSSGSKNALADIYETANYVESMIGEDVICLVTDLIVPKIVNQKVEYFHVEN
ncbi:MAG TPA: hypothetical protein VFC41_07965 [Anaerovoracaceae bacterium]|nr:hypothetical protein [Anaerovoracaceae bacterium]